MRPISTSPTKLCLLLLFNKTAVAPSRCCQQKDSTQKDEITSQKKHSWWDPLSLCRTRAGTKAKQPSQDFTQASLTAEGFVVLVDFLRSFGKGSATFQCAKRYEKHVLGNQDPEGKSFVVMQLVHTVTVTRLGSNSQSVKKGRHVDQLESWFDAGQAALFPWCFDALSTYLRARSSAKNKETSL